MANYELMLILNPNVDEASRDESLKALKALLKTNKAKVVSEDVWGEKKLAYKINKSETAYYVLMNISIDGPVIKTLSTPLNLDQNIWRYMFVKQED
jgi:small subunit ribosomal protein S6